ncbi:MAG: protoporphyrinogen oxidase HemJ [Proteobacteria bacterium]|nr:protoporphyrinogen oxidase HemJ [Pseudomonadota bacterium]
MLWIKAFHIIAVICWFAGLFYLPRIFVYHADIKSSDTDGYKRFCTMERRLFWGIMTPSAIITLLLGVGLIHAMGYTFTEPPLWLALKLVIVSLLVFYHVYCGVMLNKFKYYKNQHSAFFYRVLNEIPTLALIGAVLLVVIKPTF